MSKHANIAVLVIGTVALSGCSIPSQRIRPGAFASSVPLSEGAAKKASPYEVPKQSLGQTIAVLFWKTTGLASSTILGITLFGCLVGKIAVSYGQICIFCANTYYWIVGRTDNSEKLHEDADRILQLARFGKNVHPYKARVLTRLKVSVFFVVFMLRFSRLLGKYAMMLGNAAK